MSGCWKLAPMKLKIDMGFFEIFAHKVSEKIYEEFPVSWAWIRIKKPQALPNAQWAFVEIRKRSQAMNWQLGDGRGQKVGR